MLVIPDFGYDSIEPVGVENQVAPKTLPPPTFLTAFVTVNLPLIDVQLVKQ